MVLLAIDWSAVGVKAAQFILSFSILVVLHEMGHFIPAKWFKCRVEKFYLFFNPWFSIAKKQIGERKHGQGADEITRATMGIPEQTGVAAIDHYARWYHC